MVLWWQIVLTIVCIFLSGTFSGLTLGLMSLDLIDLRVISESGTDTEKWYAHRILPIRRTGNWLLCTLLIGNTAVNAALAIFTADLFGGIVGFLSSTFIILYVGEIIPQAVCHRFGLIVGAYAVPFVRVFMYITAPLSLLTAKLLDFFLGGEPVTRYNRSQLKSLLNMHGVGARSDPDHSIPSHSTSFILTPTTDPENRLSSSPTNDTIIELRQEIFNPQSNFLQQSGSQIDLENAVQPSNVPHPPPSPPVLPLPKDDNNGDNNNVSLSSCSQPQASESNHEPSKRNRFNPLARLYSPSRNRKHDNSHQTSKRKERDDNEVISHPPLTRDEMTMLGGAFDFSQKTVGQVMTCLDDVFMLDESVSLNFKILLLIFQSGHSRIPIYSGSRENIIGLLFAKDLILLDPEDSVPIKTVLSFFNRTVFSVLDDTRLNKMLNLFCQGGGHMAIVRKSSADSQQHSEVNQHQTYPVTIGIVTLEDLIEELIGQDIVDETDVYKNNLSKQRVKRLRSIDPDVLKMFDSTHDEEILSEKEVRVVASYLSSNVEEFSDSVIKLDVLIEMLAEIPIIECHGHERVDMTSEGSKIEHIDSIEDTDLPCTSSTTTITHPSDRKSNGLLRKNTIYCSEHLNGIVGCEGVDVIHETSVWRGNDIDTPRKVTRDNTSGDFEMQMRLSDEAMIYSRGVPTKNAYLIIHGKLEIIAGDDGFISEAGPWTLLGGRALTQDLYAPDFSARVLERPTRVLRISRKLYRLMVHASGLQGRDNGNNLVRSGNGENTSTLAASKLISEAKLAEQPSVVRRESVNTTGASRSSPSLAVAAAAAAMAIGARTENASETCTPRESNIDKKSPH